MRRTRLNRIMAAGILTMALAAGMMLPASAAQEEPASETESQAGQEKVLIGEKHSDSDYEVTLVNESGKAITGIALRASYEEYSDNLLPEDTVLEEHGEGTLWCEPAEILNFVPPEYDIQLTFADESTAVLHTIPFGDADELTILTDEESGTVYVRFISLSQNSESNSLQREKNIAQSGEEGMIADYKARTGQASAQDTGAGSQDTGAAAPAQPAPAPAPEPQQCLDNGLMF
ncbi:MAG: hypothetical protein II640_07910 [Lachnospiraceae bacterium]|nr:hypothetical protein [Lachnospiraceae bacterium]